MSPEPTGPTEARAEAVLAWSISFDGRPVPATAGESVGAALTNAGIRSWRTTRQAGRPRGLFCGVGVCYDCLLTVDGHPNQRACLVPVAPGMRLESGVGVESGDGMGPGASDG